MVDPISSNNTFAGKSATPSQAPAAPHVQPGAAPVKSDQPKTDTVQISNAAQAQILRQKGMSIPEIALQLRLDVRTVTGFFPQSASSEPA